MVLAIFRRKIMQIKTADGTASVASAGVGGAGLGLGIAGTALALLQNGGLNNILGGGCNNQYATKSDLAYAQELAKKDSEIALLKSEQNTEVKIADVYDRLITRINLDKQAQSEWNAAQMVNNCKMSNAIAVNSNSISALQNCCNSITKLVVPNSAICPGWGNVDVTITPTTTPTTGA
jgi:hypothetical protein